MRPEATNAIEEAIVEQVETQEIEATTVKMEIRTVIEVAETSMAEAGIAETVGVTEVTDDLVVGMQETTEAMPEGQVEVDASGNNPMNATARTSLTTDLYE